jgi:hypothetical protein
VPAYGRRAREAFRAALVRNRLDAVMFA